MQTREDILQKLELVTAAESSKWKERAVRKAENTRKVKDYRNQYPCPIAKTRNEPKGFGGEIAGDASNCEFQGERE